MISPLRGHGRRLLIHLLVFAVVVVLTFDMCVTRHQTSVTTFNIEDFPESRDQIEGAFQTIRDLETGLVAVQEITEPDTFQHHANRRLDGTWRFLHPDDPPHHCLGVLVHTERFEVDSVRSHEETVVHRGGRPVVEAELERPSGRRLELFVVHFKAGSEGLPIRREQYAALREILADHESSNRTTILLGDFNSTSLSDYRMLENLAASTSLRWLSRRTECTGYWEPGDTCESFSLDHMLAEGLSTRAISRGPCQSVGCDPGETCPIFHRRVSDHCPVSIRLVPSSRAR